MGDRAGFVAAIEADPDADLPRLAWADWLDDRGETERAELLRVQCELARQPSGRLRRRERAARDALGRVWPPDLLAGKRFGPQSADFDRHDLGSFFHRGCVQHLDLTERTFERHAAAFAGREPLTDVELRLWGTLPPGLADSPHLARVGQLGGRFLGPVVGSPRLTGLRKVTDCSPADVPVVAAAPAVAGLQSLGVAAGPPGTTWDCDELAAVLADTPGFAGLRWLGLDGAGLAAAQYRRLVASPHLSPELFVVVTGPGTVRPRSALDRALRGRFQGVFW